MFLCNTTLTTEQLFPTYFSKSSMIRAFSAFSDFRNRSPIYKAVICQVWHAFLIVFRVTDAMEVVRYHIPSTTCAPTHQERIRWNLPFACRKLREAPEMNQRLNAARAGKVPSHSIISNLNDRPIWGSRVVPGWTQADTKPCPAWPLLVEKQVLQPDSTPGI